MLATDVYRHATRSFLDGGDLYHTYPAERPGYGYLYPPVTVIAFLPHIVVGSSLGAFVFQTLLNFIAAIGTAIVIFRGLERRDLPVEQIDFVLLCAFMIFSTYGAIQFINGQINLWLAFALAIGFDSIDRRRGRVAGIAFGVAALFKVFPAVIGLWLLRIRDWRAVGTAIVTGVAGLLLGLALFGSDLTLTYVFDVLFGRFEGSTYDGRPEPADSIDGVHRQLAAIWPTGTAYHTLAGLFIVGGLLAGALIGVSERIERDAAALATIVAILLFLPIQPLYFPLITFPLFMLLYRPLDRTVRRILVAGTFLTLIHLEQDAVELALGWVPLPAVIEDFILSTSAAVFTFVLPPTLGLWLLLGACVLLQLRTTDPPQRRPVPTTMPA